jgi:hypothetical protein
MSLKKEIENLTGAFCEEAPEDVSYPYSVFASRRLSDSDGRMNYVLEINVWDQHRYYSRAESVMDELEQKLHRCNHITDDYLIRIFKGQRQNVTDVDKSIKRVREQFEMHVYQREEN